MGTQRTIWHVVFARHLTARRPPWITVQPEVSLSTESQRVDDLLELDVTVQDRSDPGLTLRGLWPHVVRVALLEFKSLSREFRAGDLHRLMGYGFQYLAPRQHPNDQRLPVDQMTLVLAAPSINAVMVREINDLGGALKPLGGGYHSVQPLALKLMVIDLTEVAEYEDDDYLRWFGRNRARTREVLRWAEQNSHTRSSAMDPHDLEDYEDFARKIAESLTVEQRLAGIAPEQRLAGIAPEEVVLALPDAVLAGLSEEFIATLPADVQQIVKTRRAHA